MPKESIKDKLEGKELDLSLSSLTTVPVKEIVSYNFGLFTGAGSCFAPHYRSVMS